MFFRPHLFSRGGGVEEKTWYHNGFCGRLTRVRFLLLRFLIFASLPKRRSTYPVVEGPFHAIATQASRFERVVWMMCDHQQGRTGSVSSLFFSFLCSLLSPEEKKTTETHTGEYYFSEILSSRAAETPHVS